MFRKEGSDLPFGTESPDLDVLIVGAGLSGLTSAIKILSKEPSLNIKIIDENEAPGGQLGNHGTRFLDSAQEEMVAFMTSFKVFPRRRLSIANKQKRCWDLDEGVTAGPAKFELWRYINMLDMRMKKFHSPRFKLRKRSPKMEPHICHNLFFTKSRRFMMNLVELTCGADAGTVYYDEFMCVCSTCGGIRTLIDFYFSFSNNMYEVSSKKLVDGIMEKLKDVQILNNRRALEVKHFKNYVEVTDTGGDTHIAHTVILAIPWNKVEQLKFEPEMPKQFAPSTIPRATAQSKRLITQFCIVYPKPFWEVMGYSGNFLCSTPLVVGHVNLNKTTEYVGYILHTSEEADRVRGIVLQKLASRFGEDMHRPLNYQQNTYELNTALHAPQIKPWYRIIWSSSAAVGTHYRNLMGGAVQSGQRAAINALFVIRPQVVAWKDLLDLDKKYQYGNSNPSRLSGLLSRFNIYNVCFYSIFVLGLLCFLNYTYKAVRSENAYA